MPGPTGWHWFPATEQLWLRRPAPAVSHYRAALLDPSRLLGEVAPRTVGTVVSLAPAPPSPFTVALQAGPTAAAGEEAAFTAGPALGADVGADGALHWTAFDWRNVELKVLAWRGPALELLHQELVPAGWEGLAVRPEWSAAEAELLLTPFDEDGRQGPSEAVPVGFRGEDLTFLEEALQSAGLEAALGEPRCGREIRQTPWLVLDALCSALARLRERNRRPLQGIVCQALGLPPSTLAFLQGYRRRPELVHLLAASTALAAVVQRHGVPYHYRGLTAAALLAHALSGGRGDPEFERHLAAEGTAEVEFWTKAIYDNVHLSGLRELRVERRCKAAAAEAPELLAALKGVERQPVEELEALLVPGAASALHDAAAAAARARRTALDGSGGPAAVRSAAAAADAAAAALADHLALLLRGRAGGLWAPLREVHGLAERRELPDAIRRLRDLGREAVNGWPADGDAVPAATPPCLLRLDAAWLRRVRAEEEGRRRQVGRAAGWCRELLAAGRLAPVADAPVLDLKEIRDALEPAWQAFRGAGVGDEVEAFCGELPVDLGPTADAVTAGVAEARALLAAAGGIEEAAVVGGVLDGLNERPLLAAARVREGDLRKAVLWELDGLASHGDCREVRERRAELAPRARVLAEGPLTGWGELRVVLAEWRDCLEAEGASRELWAELLQAAPADLHRLIGVGANDAAGAVALDSLAALVERNQARAREALADRAARARGRAAVLEEALAACGAPMSRAGDVEPKSPPAGFPRYAADAYRVLVELTKSAGEAAARERHVNRREAELRSHAEGRMRRAWPTHLPEPISDATRRDRDAVAQRLEEAMAAGRLADYVAALGRLDRVAAVLARRERVFCLSQHPSGEEFLRAAAAPCWVRRREDRPLVGLLRDAAAASRDAAGLLTDPERLGRAEAALEDVIGAERGRERRWWVRLYRDLFETLRGRLADLPAGPPAWRPPRVASREDAAEALAWLERVGRPGRDESGPPDDWRRALVAAGLLIDGSGEG